MTLEKYVREKWLPHHQMELTTREKYISCLDRHILPELGPIRMIDILPEHIRGWVTGMVAKKASPWVIQYCKYAILNAIMQVGGPPRRKDYVPKPRRVASTHRAAWKPFSCSPVP
ncbi:MAG: integrase family protein [Actinomycetia bacterium]|nr:integrase family protein [Actinomycetes bacterium]